MNFLENFPSFPYSIFQRIFLHLFTIFFPDDFTSFLHSIIFFIFLSFSSIFLILFCTSQYFSKQFSSFLYSIVLKTFPASLFGMFVQTLVFLVFLVSPTILYMVITVLRQDEKGKNKQDRSIRCSGRDFLPRSIPPQHPPPFISGFRMRGFSNSIKGTE